MLTNGICNTRFLENYPTHRQLKHLRIEKSLVKYSYYHIQSLPYFDLINELVLSTLTLTRLTFSKVYPASSLIVSASALTRLQFLSFLTNITGLAILADISFHLWPPEPFSNQSLSSIKSSMP